MMKMKMKNLKILMILIPIVFLSACTDHEKNKLDNRVLDYWKYKVEKDFVNAYEFLSPGWKSTESKESYVKRMNSSAVKWIKSRVIKKQCSQTDLCVVFVGITYEYTFKGIAGEATQVETQLKENWVLKDNMWYHVPKK